MWIEDFVVLPLLQHASEKQLKIIKYKSWLIVSKVPAHSLFCFIAFQTILKMDIKAVRVYSQGGGWSFHGARIKNVREKDGVSIFRSIAHPP